VELARRGSAATVSAVEQVPLARYTTLRLGGPARRLVEAGTQAEIIAQVQAADARDEPLLVLGGGSNLVIADDGFPGTVVRVTARGNGPATGAAGQRQPGDALSVTVPAGENWDTVVAWAVAEGLAGIECLSGIPGLVGATPIQNVGAYGQEVAETVTSVRVYDRTLATVTEVPATDCGFGYRTSDFKRQAQAAAATGRGGPTGRSVVLAVTFRLQRSPLSRPIRYRELARVLGVTEGASAPLAEVRAAVLDLRRAKGMVLDPGDPDTRSAGSFFVNPVLTKARFAALEEAAARNLGENVVIPQFPAADGDVKVPAAWLIEKAGFRKGYMGATESNGAGPRISSKHTLALVNPGGATAASLVGLARDVRDGVRRTFGVDLHPEPTLVGLAL
jgi:UDP-N-acetylmuramate dehydrogenase